MNCNCATCGHEKQLVRGQKPNKYFVCMDCQALMEAAGKCKLGHDLSKHGDPNGKCRACKRVQDRGYAEQTSTPVQLLNWPAPRV